MIGIVLMLALVVVRAGTITVLEMGLASTQLDQATDVEVLVEGKCPGFQSTEFEPPDFAAVAEAISENNCALWLEAGNVETDGDGNVTTWYDAGPNDFHATQSDEDDPSSVIQSGLADETVIDVDGENQDGADRGDKSGSYLRLHRSVEDLNLDDDSGLIVFAVLRAESFNRAVRGPSARRGNRGGSSRADVQNFDGDGCKHNPPEGHWRAQHWDDAAIHYERSETDDQ